VFFLYATCTLVHISSVFCRLTFRIITSGPQVTFNISVSNQVMFSNAVCSQVMFNNASSPQVNVNTP